MNHLLLQLFFTIILAGQSFANEPLPFLQKVTLDRLTCYEVNGNNDYDWEIVEFLPRQEKELVSPKVDQNKKLNVPPYNWELARKNGALANEGFERSNRSMHAWEKHRHGESLLYGDRIIEGDKFYDLWLPQNAAADCYPFHVLTAALTEQKMLTGEMTSMLNSEIEHTSRDLGDGKHILPDVWNIANHSFESKEPDLFDITFGVSEYCKDGLMPISEWMGTNTAWYERMVSMTDYMWENHAIGKSDLGEDIILANKDLSSTHNVEAHGEQLQVLPRLYWATGDNKYKEWAIRLGDHYLLGNHHPTEDFEYLRLRDHGNEIISGLSELYAMLSILKHPKAEKYRAPLYRMLDKVLEAGRNEDGLFHDDLYPQENKRSGRIADNFGYVYNAFYITYMIDRNSSDMSLRTKVENYRREMIRGLENLDQEKYYNFNWEGQSSDGYADALEGAINLYNREPLSRVAKWIDSEMQVLWGFQGENGYSQKIYPDGNFCRTSLMYSLWKTQGIHTKDWRNDLEFGAAKTPDGSGILLTVVAKENDWKGSLIFDQPRHQTYFNMPVDYPRINSFSEWFTVDVNKEYMLIELDNVGSQNKLIVKGTELINGLQLNLKTGEEKRFIIEKK